ncbi:hypothetical protein FSP39_011268 [Pinctada imbricata]|uniref:Fucosyltransferase n=1 Tax=Pinctada imbricata TaxID=66713 RepID=A0AA88Y4C5_PINIB|nr:hypothetical protein FSP39_011268 [Pinctada imbricata]
MESSLHVYPQSVDSRYGKLLPDPADPVNDRIYEQLHHVPIGYSNKSNIKIKTIYLHGGKNQWFIEEGRDFFFTTGCKVNHCSFTYNRQEGRTADVVVFGNPYQLPFRPPWPRKSQKQIWMMSALETPPHTTSMRKYIGHFNWTMSYRTDSIIVSPYFKYEAFPEKKVLPYKNHAAGKKKKVAWFVTNCFNVESGRMEYAKELQKYIDIDIFGGCGTKRCRKSEWDKCRQMVQRDYKFYLAFENSKCKDYLTEKVQTGLLYDAIPIVLGAATWEYANALPAHSYIDVEDFKSPKHLAEYLQKLDENDDLFNEYFRWKSYGTFVETKPWCRVCSMVHDESFPTIWYDNVDSWWHAKSACIKKDTHWWYNVVD